MCFMLAIIVYSVQYRVNKKITGISDFLLTLTLTPDFFANYCKNSNMLTLTQETIF
jgi:hypothetical protein